MRHHAFRYACPVLLVLTTALIIAGFACSDKSTGPQEIPAPEIASISPERGPVGTRVEIRGHGFGNQQGTVNFQDAAAEIISWSDTLIIAKVPGGASSGNLVVKVAGAPSNAIYFEVLHIAITSVEPDSGAAGEEITIRGQYFGSTQGSVSIGNVIAPIESWSDTLIVITIPENAESGNLVVSNEFESSNQMMIRIVSGSASTQGLESTNYVEIIFSGYNQYEQINYNIGIPVSTDTISYYKAYSTYNHYEQWPLSWDADSCYLEYEGEIQDNYSPGVTTVLFTLRVWFGQDGDLLDSLTVDYLRSTSYGLMSGSHSGGSMVFRNIGLDLATSDSLNFFYAISGPEAENHTANLDFEASSYGGTEDQTTTIDYIGTDWDNEEYPPEIQVIFRQK